MQEITCLGQTSAIDGKLYRQRIYLLKDYNFAIVSGHRRTVAHDEEVCLSFVHLAETEGS